MSELSDDWADSEGVHEAIARVGGPNRAAVLTKWVVIAEWMDGDGEKLLVGYRGPQPSSIPLWDVEGMLEYGKDMDFGLVEYEDDEDAD